MKNIKQLQSIVTKIRKDLGGTIETPEKLSKARQMAAKIEAGWHLRLLEDALTLTYLDDQDRAIERGRASHTHKRRG